MRRLGIMSGCPVAEDHVRFALAARNRCGPGGCSLAVCGAGDIAPDIAATWARQPNVSIQAAMACPISSGESYWTKWSPATVTSVCAGNPRAKSRFAPAATSKPGSAFTNSLGTRLVASQFA